MNASFDGSQKIKHQLLSDWFPLKEEKHSGSWYVSFKFQNKDICAALSQAKVFSSARLYSRLGQVAEDDMQKIKDGFRELYLGK